MFLGLFFMACFVAVAIIAIGTSIIRGILNFILGLFGIHRQTYNQANQSRQSQAQSQSQHSQQSATSSGKKRENIFDKSDGEYVDFEEIKE